MTLRGSGRLMRKESSDPIIAGRYNGNPWAPQKPGAFVLAFNQCMKPGYGGQVVSQKQFARRSTPSTKVKGVGNSVHDVLMVITREQVAVPIHSHLQRRMTSKGLDCLLGKSNLDP